MQASNLLPAVLNTVSVGRGETRGAAVAQLPQGLDGGAQSAGLLDWWGFEISRTRRLSREGHIIIMVLEDMQEKNYGGESRHAVSMGGGN